MLTLWALVVVMPDAVRIVHPLGTLGFFADNNGSIYSVDESGPAAKAGVKVGDRISIETMSCRTLGPKCAQLLSVFGGMGGLQYVRSGAVVSLELRGAGQNPAAAPKRVTIASQPEAHGTNAPDRALWRFALAADELGALAFILCSAWLLWHRPCTMTAGFFAYALWFNPGQYFEFYSWLQGHPIAMFAQETLQTIFQSLGYVGFVVLALYFPNDVSRPNLRWAGAALPWVFGILTVLQLASFLNAFGIGTELVTRVTYIAGWSVDAAVLFYILPVVLLDQPPEERARTRWLLVGCVIGLSSFIFADFNEATTMSPMQISETAIQFFYFANVITLAVVIYTVRHHRVVNVAFTLTRGIERLGMWAMVAALGAFLIHRIDEHLGSELHWDEVGISLALVCTTLAWERVQEFAIELLDYVLFPRFRKSLVELRTVARDLCDLDTVVHIERSLIEQSARVLHVSSAAVFRLHRSGIFRRYSATGWPPRTLREFQPDGTLVTDYLKGNEGFARLRSARWAKAPLPDGVALPTVAVPVHAFGRLYAVLLYSAHTKGDDLNGEEIEVLEGLARSAALAYEAATSAALRRQVRFLKRVRK
ncbi:MAG: hypothetical protein NVS2B17_10930 [Candidatus Velthaea sp.]